MTLQDAQYLKHAGEQVDVKVSIRIVGRKPMIYMRDFQFDTFQRALVFLRHVAESEFSPMAVRS